MASRSPHAYAEQSDADLLASIQAGDTAAFGHFCTAYRSRLSGFLKRFINSRETIEEIVNDTFMVVWFRAGGFRAESKVSTWMFGVAYRLAMKACRRNRHSDRSGDLHERGGIVTDPASDVELQDWLLHLLQTLVPDQRNAIVLGYLYGYSIQEMSKMTYAPAGTVKSRLFHGRQGLRAKMAAGCSYSTGSRGSTSAQRDILA